MLKRAKCNFLALLRTVVTAPYFERVPVGVLVSPIMALIRLAVKIFLLAKWSISGCLKGLLIVATKTVSSARGWVGASVVNSLSVIR